MMKIGLFTDTYYPQVNGVAASVLILKENLEKLGHEVYVFTTTDPNAREYEKNVYRVPSIPFKSSKRLGTIYHPRLVKVIRGLGLDIIHTHTEFSLGILGKRMAVELNIPLVHTYHTIYEHYTHYILNLGRMDTIARKVSRKISASFCNLADEIITPTEKVKNLLLSYNVKKNISVIPTGLNMDKYNRTSYSSDMIQEIRFQLGIKENEKVVIYIGRLSEEKNIKEILSSMQSYLKKKIDVKLLIVGDGPERKNLEDLAKNLQINDKTVFAGEKPWKEIGAYYQLGDVFVSASQSETQGLTYIEALASGLPVIAKKDRCLDGVILEGINGYTFDSSEDFVHHLECVLSNEQLRSSLSEWAVKSAWKFSADYFSASIEGRYKYIISYYTNDKIFYNKLEMSRKCI
jgi:1,2-diacylglycerol 3-alpha-glucosyltransferase